MKIKWLVLLIIVFLVVSVFSQQIKEETLVVNIEVPVRVFNKDLFVDSLTIDDFEVFEDGKAQKIQAVYLVNERNIARKEERRRFSPDTSRNFYLFFEISEYDPRLGEAVDYFLKNVIYPGDVLVVVTPTSSYRLRGRALELKSREEVVKQLVGILRKDALIGSSEYRGMIQELTELASSVSASLEQREGIFAREDTAFLTEQDWTPGEKLLRYQYLIGRLEEMRYVSQEKLVQFAQIIEEEEGQKYVFIFYQNEYIPQIDPKVLTQYMALYQDRPNIEQTVSGIMDFYRRDLSFDVDKIKKIYADNSIAIHFLFVSRVFQNIPGVIFQERSEDIFSAFQEMADATGGYIESSARPEWLMQKAVEASKRYYLVYYSPENYTRDGSFKNIEVRIPGQNFRIVHRQGYIAD
ncbi:MAG: hypothetical protein GF421_05340 [Candidatus Aminicenantes bacterium]|nr:hypothetical protein [Candidatus Aminicenantes bacterium]